HPAPWLLILRLLKRFPRVALANGGRRGRFFLDSPRLVPRAWLTHRPRTPQSTLQKGGRLADAELLLGRWLPLARGLGRRGPHPHEHGNYNGFLSYVEDSPEMI